MIHNVDRLMTGNTECELTTERSGDTNCPRLESTPGEGDASDRSTDWSAKGHMSGRTFSVSGMNCLSCAVVLLPTDKLYATIQRIDTPVYIEIDSLADINDAVIVRDDEPILRRRLPRTEVFAEGVEQKCMAPCTDSSSTIQNSQIFRRANPWRRVVSTEKDMHGSTVKRVFTVAEPSDLLRRRRSWPPNRGGTEGGASVRAHIRLVCQTNFYFRRTKMRADEMTTIYGYHRRVTTHTVGGVFRRTQLLRRSVDCYMSTYRFSVE